MCRLALKWARYDVDVADAAARVGEIPEVAVAKAISCGAYNCTGWTSKSVTDPCLLIKYLATVFESTHDGQMYTGVGFEDGTSYFVHRGSDGGFIVDVRDAQNTLGQGTLYTSYGLDSSTGCVNTSDVRGTPSSYDCRSRGWYTTTKSTKSPGWGTGVYADHGTGDLIITASRPLYASDGVTFIGSWLSDVSLASISKSLAVIKYGKSGVGYITENQNGVDLLVASSTGDVVNPVTNARLTPSESSNSQIVDSYKYLVDHYGSNGTLGWGYSKYTVGDIIEGVPISAISPYIEITHSLPFNMVLTFPEADYSEFVLWSFYLTLAFEGVQVMILAMLIWMSFTWSNKSDVELLQTRFNNGLIIVTFVIPSVLWLWWLVVTKEYTDVVVEDALAGRTDGLAEYFTWSWEEYPFLHALAIGEYLLGLLPFGAENPTAGSNGTILEKHFADDLLLRGDGSYFPQILSSYVGFSNGDFSGMIYICKYEACTDGYDERIVAGLRSSSNTSSELIYYNTVADSTGTSRIRNESGVYKNYGPYSSATRPWYQQAVTAGRAGNSRYGNAIVTETFDWGSNQIVAVAQAFYDTSGNVEGVVCIETNITSLSTGLKMIAPSTDSQASVVEKYGEVLGASNFQVSLPASNGGYRQLGVLNSMMSSLKKYATDLWQKENDYTKVQNDTNLEGTYVEVSAPIGVYNTSWLFLPDKLTQWTTLMVVPRHVYFGELDDGAETNFVIVVFSLFTIGYGGWLLTYNLTPDDTVEDIKDVDAPPSPELRESSQAPPGSPAGSPASDPARCAQVERIAMQSSLSAMQETTIISPLSFTDSGTMEGEDSLWARFGKHELTAWSLEFVQSFRDAANVIQNYGVNNNISTAELDKILDTDIDELDPKELAWESLMPDAEKDVARKDALLWNLALEHNIKLLVDQWGIAAGDPKLQLRLQSKAARVQQLRDQGVDPFVAIALEGRTGEDSGMTKLFYLFEMPLVRNGLLLGRMLYQLGAFFTDDIFRRYWDVFFLIPYSVHSIFLYFKNTRTFGRVEDITWINLAFTVWLWIFQIFIAAVGLEGDSSMQFVYNLIRPWMVITKSERLRCAFVVMKQSLAEASRIFFFLICVIMVASLMFLILFENKFDLQIGGTVNSFLDSLVVTFIFLTSGENWDQFVYQGYAQDKMSFLLFVPYSFAGIIMLMSMVIATFELSFSNHQDMLKREPQTLQWTASSLSFMMLTWESSVQIDFLDGVLAKRAQLKDSNVFGTRYLVAKVKGYNESKKIYFKRRSGSGSTMYPDR
jgi:hypothetical protein